ncbi:MAG: hypothetical protein ACLFM5_10885 [Spirochaetaceae bacterium]
MQRPSGPQSQYRHLVVDLVLVGLLFVNLALIIFDWLFAVEAVRAFFGRVSPAAAAWYDTAVHPNFVLIDLAFVAVFLTDFTISWIVAVVHRLYHRWFFYPFVHWYDLLGCVPIAGFRFLRLLRIITIVYRLHRTGIIDLAETVPGRVIAKYYGVLLEEVSDRVILKMLSDAQDEVIRGGPLLDQIIAEVLEPRKAELSEWVSQRMRTVAAENYERYRDELESYIRRRVGRALQDNTELGMLRTVPVAGPLIRARVERGITEMITHVMNGVAADLTSERNKPVVDEAASVFLDTIVLKQQEGELSRIVIDTIDRSLEVVKRHVSVQQWKLRERAADEDDYARRLAEALRGEPEG